jgi:hypothetical protein
MCIVVHLVFFGKTGVTTCRSTGARTPASPAPHPFGAGRRGCTSHPLEPLEVCAVAPATCRAHARTNWCPVQRSRVRRRSSDEAPPRRSCLQRARCRAFLNVGAFSWSCYTGVAYLAPEGKGQRDAGHSKWRSVASQKKWRSGGRLLRCSAGYAVVSTKWSTLGW